MNRAAFIEVNAGVRYWEDATVNGIEDEKGDLIPLRVGESWRPIIDLANGNIVDWPEGTEASIHYKVCDDGEYWLLDTNKNRIAKWKGCYVPGSILCVKTEGFGDYIIFKVGKDGNIKDWTKPSIDDDEWEPITTEFVASNIMDAILNEREACAKVCENLAKSALGVEALCADAIRARGRVGE
jgi:hypothetical protein